MYTLSHSFHSCQYCEQIEIDGTKYEQRFEFSFCEVKAFAQHCAFFRRSLELSNLLLDATNKLILSICEDSEDFHCLHIYWGGVNSHPISEDDMSLGLYIFSKDDDYAARYIKSRPLAESPGKLNNLERCLKRYKSCLNHEKCRTAFERHKNDRVPTRLLDIRPNLQERLYTVPQGENPPYAVLSYCWGDTQQQKDGRTIRANVQDRHRGIATSQLPQSIRDAIVVTKHLGLSYLWVDALCIVQDDPQDRTSEISKMGSIYGGFTVTIAAASAKNSADGFLKDRDLEKAYGSMFRLPYYNKRAGDELRGSVMLSEQPVRDTYQEYSDERAWTMQEDILSLRLIRFGSKQTTWRCLKYSPAISVDGGGRPILENEDSAFAVTDPYRVAEIQSNVSAYGPLGTPSMKASWLNTISKYTHRKLSNPSDRLPACAALAEIFAEISGLNTTDYLAGLWKNDIQAQLLWYRLEGTKSERSIGPSWSWASMNGPVGFFHRELLEYDFTVKAAAKHVDSDIDYKFDEHRYHQVRSDRLKLNGRLQHAYWDSVSFRRSIDDVRVLPLKICWDVPDTVKAQTVWCFEIIGSYLSLGIVLVTEDWVHLERAGFFECNRGGFSIMKSYFDEVEPQTIALY